MKMSVWRDVISSLEEIVSLYDEVNEVISLGRASKARTYAAQRVMENHPKLVLDSGAGPGSMTVILLKLDSQAEVVGLDFSSQLQRACKERVKDHRDRVHFVRARFEQLPFRSGSFDAIVTAYALRDSTDIKQAVAEYARSIKNEGQLAIVEMGKPDNRVKRFFAMIYVRFIMPLIAKIVISGRLEDNPFRMIIPTYKNLPTTLSILRMLEAARFNLQEKKQFLAGGMLVLLLKSRSSLIART